MKITPIKEYKTPKYAAKAAALLAVTASASGCIGPVLSGAAVPPETTTTPASATYETTSSDETINLNATTEDTTISGTVTTVTEEEIECTELAGDVPAPTDTTTEAVGIGSVFSAAIGKIKSILGGDETEHPRLEGDVPMITDEPEIEGDVYAPEVTDDDTGIGGLVPATSETEEEFWLEGDVEAPTEDMPDDFYFANYCCDALYDALEGYCSSIIFHDPDNVDNLNLSDDLSFPAQWECVFKDFFMEITFVRKDSGIGKSIAAAENWNDVAGGGLFDAKSLKKTSDMSGNYEIRYILAVFVDDYDTDLTEEFCNALVSDLELKGVI